MYKLNLESYMSAKRLLVSLEEEVFNDIVGLAKINKKSSSKVAHDLIVASLELQEDKMFSKLADERIKTTTEWISHSDAWK
jgi:hypothetical protein